jgi:hypothetical protein
MPDVENLLVTRKLNINPFLEASSHKNRCLSCGTSENIGRRRYCSVDCRKGLHYKLDIRTGLIKALDTRYATFCFSEKMIVIGLLPYGSVDTYSFFYPRSPGKKPAEDFGYMADLLGELWWAEKKRTNKRYVASRYVLERAFRNVIPLPSVKPVTVKVPSIKRTVLADLEIDKSMLTSPDLQRIVKDAYRRQAKEYHPDCGGDAVKFRNVFKAYQELMAWAKNPTFVMECGFTDKWLYSGNTNSWKQPLPLRKSAEGACLRISW